MPDPDLAAASIVVAAGRPTRSPGAAVSPPVELTSTYVADGPVNYGRAGNATWSAFEEVLGRLEGGRALVFASGMAAISAALSLVPQRGVVVAPDSAYSLTGVLLDELEQSGLIGVRRVTMDQTAAVVAALDGAAAVWVESPTNPMLEVADLPTLCEAARQAGAIVFCDNTFATPLGQQPLAYGVDVVVHSATKFLSGHADVVLGAAVVAEARAGGDRYQRLAQHRLVHGAIAGPSETWLALRGMRTLHLRVERASANAHDLAERLRGHPAVAKVRYPGFGAIVSIELVGDAVAAEQVTAAVRLWTHATSLGGVESLLERRRRNAAEPKTVPENLIRLSVGIEDVDDLWRDLDQALRASLVT